MQQVAMRAMDLDGVDAETCRTSRGVRESVADARESFGVERGRRVPALVIRQRGGRNSLPAIGVIRRELLATLPGDFGRRFAACVCELDRDRHPGPATDGLERPTDCLLRLVRPEPDVGVR